MNVVDCGFEVLSCQTNHFKVSICCSFVYHLALRNKTHDCLAGRIIYLRDVDFCVSEPALWKLTQYVGLVQASSSGCFFSFILRQIQVTMEKTYMAIGKRGHVDVLS
jgi:hypothetical protein